MRRSRPFAIAERRLDHDREVALEQLPRELRSAFSALWNLDLAFADVVATSSDPRIGGIRLAWWRERLEQLDDEKSAPAEPRLQAVLSHLLSKAVTGAELAQLEDAWLPLLEPFPWTDQQVTGLRLRGKVLFSIGARILQGDSQFAEAVGELWSLIDGAQHCSDAVSRSLLLRSAATVVLPAKSPPRLRPLTIIAALAMADVTNRGRAFGRGLAALRHRLTGRFPRA